MKNALLFNFWSRIKERHQNYRKRGVYGYMWITGLKVILAWVLIMTPIILIGKYLIDFNSIFGFIIDNLSNVFVLLVFLVSESFLGMIPPDLFVIWTSKFSNPASLWVLLGILSYTGGVVSYFIGHWLSKRKRIKTYSEKALEKYINLVRKWGGAFIIISALFPFSPYSMIVIAVSLFRYPLKLYLFFGISRIIRFVVQGYLYLHVLNMDSYFASLS
jgi:membrane protein YqaA with SNARE-associated domain